MTFNQLLHHKMAGLALIALAMSTPACFQGTNDDTTQTSDGAVALECKTLGAPCTEACLAKDDTCATEEACAAAYETCVADEVIKETLSECAIEYEECVSDLPDAGDVCDTLQSDCETLAVSVCEKSPDDCSIYCEAVVVDYCQTATTLDSSRTRSCLDTLGDCYETNDDTADAEARYGCNTDAVDCFADIMDDFESTCVAPPC